MPDGVTLIMGKMHVGIWIVFFEWESGEIEPK